MKANSYTNCEMLISLSTLENRFILKTKLLNCDMLISFSTIENRLILKTKLLIKKEHRWLNGLQNTP